MKSLNLTIAIAALFLSGCTSVATHHSARPVGKGNLEVGFSAAMPTYRGIIAKVGTVGSSEGYMRYGLGNRVDGSFNAGPTSLGVHADFAVIARDSFNLSTGLGFGLVGAKLSSTGIVSDELDLSIEDLPGGGGIGIGPDFNVKASFGSLENEGTVGLRVAYFGGGAGSSTSSGTVSGTNTSGGSLMGGPVFSFTHRGDRLIITPEIDVLFGKSMIQAQQDLGLTGFAAFIVPSVTFAMVK